MTPRFFASVMVSGSQHAEHTHAACAAQETDTATPLQPSSAHARLSSHPGQDPWPGAGSRRGTGRRRTVAAAAVVSFSFLGSKPRQEQEWRNQRHPCSSCTCPGTTHCRALEDESRDVARGAPEPRKALGGQGRRGRAGHPLAPALRLCAALFSSPAHPSFAMRPIAVDTL